VEATARIFRTIHNSPIEERRMTTKRCIKHAITGLVVAFASVVFAAAASADPPARVARLAYLSGVVSFEPAGESEWVPATVNRPLFIGDSLWTDPQSRAELQMGAVAVRIRGDTSLSILNFDDRIAQFNLAQGTLSVRIWQMPPGGAVEIDTPVLAFSIQRPGAYRIDVDPSGQSTTVAVRSGQAVIYGQDASSYLVDANQSYTFAGSLNDFHAVRLAALDEFDRWGADRDRRWNSSPSLRYVSRETIGFDDLDGHGQWRTVQDYGTVWVPAVSPGWVPYRDGHWAWVDPWGWTWIDDAPWGFAVSHYGRWAYANSNWCWVPGPVNTRPVYAPALVAFVGGTSLQGTSAGIAWFPLAPREVYRPSYTVSRNYFNAVNTSNTRIDNAVVTRDYANANTANVTYANRHVPGAVIAVPDHAFTQAQPVRRARIEAAPEMLQRAPVTTAVALPPERTSVLGHTTPAKAAPPAGVLSRTVVARTAPPPPPAAVEMHAPQPGAAPGKAPEADRSVTQRTIPTREGPKVVVVNPPKGAAPRTLTGPGATPAAPANGGTVVTRSGVVVPRAPEAGKGTPPVGNNAAANSTPPAAPSPAQAQRAPERGNNLTRERSVASPAVAAQAAAPGVPNLDAERARAAQSQQQAQQAREAQVRQAEQAKSAQAQQRQAQQAQRAQEAQARQQAEQAKSAQAQQRQAQQARETQARQQVDQARSAQAQQRQAQQAQQSREAQARQQAEQVRAAQAQQHAQVQQQQQAQAQQRAAQVAAAQAQQRTRDARGERPPAPAQQAPQAKGDEARKDEKRGE
jgi:hypothetical protein